MKMDVNCR